MTDDEWCMMQGVHSSGKLGKPANVSEVDSYQGNIRDFTKSHGKNLVKEVAKNCLLLVAYLGPYRYLVASS